MVVVEDASSDLIPVVHLGAANMHPGVETEYSAYSCVLLSENWLVEEARGFVGLSADTVVVEWSAEEAGVNHTASGS